MSWIRFAIVGAAIGMVPVIASGQTPKLAQGKSQAQPSNSSGATAEEPGGEIKAVTQAIVDEIDKHSELMANIEYLCDMIGPRLTGSVGLAKANRWTRDKFQQYGLSNAHLEPWTIDRAWTRRSKGTCRSTG